jgi:hypothetical protein
MTLLTPSFQNVLTKLHHTVHQEGTVTTIQLEDDKVTLISPTKSSYTLGIRPKKRNLRRPLVDTIHDKLHHYLADIAHAEEQVFNFFIEPEGSLQRKLEVCYEYLHSNQQNSFVLETYAYIGRLLRSYQPSSPDYKAIQKMLKKLGFSTKIVFIAARAMELLEARSGKMREYIKITPWVLTRAHETDWQAMIDHANSIRTTDDLYSPELNSDGWDMLPNDPES